MLAALTHLAAGGFVRPHVDYHAIAPEIVLVATIVVVLVADLVFDERKKWATSTIAGLGLLGSLIPVVTLAVNGHDRVMFGGAYVVDNFALISKALFLIAGYLVVLLSTNYIGEGDYAEGEYYFLLLSSIFGMLIMGSARDLISIFVALETLSIPAYMLAGWRKRDVKSNEASMKYFLLGVFASAVMLYGMSLLYGVTGTTILANIGPAIAKGHSSQPIITLSILFLIVGFAFKVSAVPFHSWAPDTYEGAPTPITAFLSVASKAAGFVALAQIVYVGVLTRSDVFAPFFWILAALTMTVGNLVALKQTNIVRMLAYSSIAQAGYMLVPFAMIGQGHQTGRSALTAVITYLLVYVAMNIGAFAVIIAVARKTRSAEISSFGGLFSYAPGLTVLMSVFLFSLAGIPPLGGWIAKFTVFRSVLDAGTGWAAALGVIAAINSVIALYYYASVAKEMWMKPTPDGDTTPVKVPASLGLALGLTALATVVIGVIPNFLVRFGDLANLAASVTGK